MAETPTTRSQLLALLDAGHAEWRAALSAVADDAFAEAVMPGWTRGDIVAHVEWWEDRSALVVEALLAGREPYPRDAPFDLDNQNDQTRRENAGRAPADLRDGEARAWARLRVALAAASDDDLFETDTFRWLGGDALVDLVRGDTDEHWAEHLPHLR